MSRILPFKLLLSALLLLPAIGLEAQKPDPVAWETSVESMGEDVYLLRIEARIEAPWHIYDTGPYEGGPNPTTISFESGPMPRKPCSPSGYGSKRPATLR